MSLKLFIVILFVFFKKINLEKQFFAHDKFPIFTFEDKRTFREYGEVVIF